MNFLMHMEIGVSLGFFWPIFQLTSGQGKIEIPSSMKMQREESNGIPHLKDFSYYQMCPKLTLGIRINLTHLLIDRSVFDILV